MANLKLISAAMLAAVAVAACGAQPAPSTQPAQTGGSTILVKDAWARPTTNDMPGMSDMIAAYMTIDNTGSAPDTLLNVSSDVAGSITLHQTKDTNGMLSMTELKDGLDVPANGSVALKPASYHLMLADLKRALRVGDTFKLTLRFKNGKELLVDVVVREP